MDFSIQSRIYHDDFLMAHIKIVEVLVGEEAHASIATEVSLF